MLVGPSIKPAARQCFSRSLDNGTPPAGVRSNTRAMLLPLLLAIALSSATVHTPTNDPVYHVSWIDADNAAKCTEHKDKEQAEASAAQLMKQANVTNVQVAEGPCTPGEKEQKEQ